MSQPVAKTAIKAAPGPSIDEFEALDVDPERFDHQAHVYVAWLYLQQCDLLESIDRYRSTLKRLTAKFGVPGKYHETITWFFLIAVAEGATGDAAADWSVFREENSLLFGGSPNIVDRCYSGERINSDKARMIFLLPDRPTAV